MKEYLHDQETQFKHTKNTIIYSDCTFANAVLIFINATRHVSHLALFLQTTVA